MNTKTDVTVEKSDAALREETILEFWREHDIFNKSLTHPGGLAEPKGDYVFYDGPPFATGLPHYGHILPGAIKDAIPRFWTMQGYRVRRKWGWDCHGLPLENLIEKKLGLATKRDIEAYGVKNFNEAARSAVLEYADDWRRIIPRMGRFVDMDDDYKTMDSSYTESVWWVFKQLHEKGLVYEGFKGMHLCPRCGTTLSNFEVNQGYKDIKDIAVTVKLPLLDDAGNPTDTSLLVWTTTPWTLPGNMAAAVHKEGMYINATIEKIEGQLQGFELVEGESYIYAKDCELTIFGGDRGLLEGSEFGKRVINVKGATIFLENYKEIEGSELVGKSYQPPFDYWQKQEFENKANAWKIYHADYVELGEEGTGAVHLAPAYGEEDMELAKREGVPIVHHVDGNGHFMDFVTDFAGQLVKPKDDDEAGVTHLDADIEIVKALKANGRLFKKENITHSYPHCWRCDTPLLNYATTSWFVEVTKIRDELVAANNTVKWVPEHVGANRFGKWLENARDWAVSRQRYWGAPLPVWRNPETKEVKVFGSLKELLAFLPQKHNRYFVMRHAEATSNLSGVIDAIADENNPLTPAGEAQCAAVAERLRAEGITKIVHSGMQRTRETATRIAAALGLPAEAVVEETRIKEFQTGPEWEGKTWAEFNDNFATEAEKFTKQLPGVESRLDLIKRVGDALYDFDATHDNETVLFVGHGSSIFALQCAAEAADMKRVITLKEAGYLKNGEVAELVFTQKPHNDYYQLDYHRPYIDEVALYEGEVKLERVPDVFDCWFESGSMPYAETHYPFENLEVANIAEGVRFPANFIAESVDQTRGWFYSLMVLGVALFGKSPYEHVITNGLVLAEDGKKMSKKLQNYPDPVELVDRQGADSMRFYLLSSAIIRGEDLNFSEKEVAELQRKNIGRLHNVLAMYEQYADSTVEPQSDSTNVLDRWMVARLHQTVAEITAGFTGYELDKATRPITDLIDDLSVWYLRRSRERLKGVRKSEGLSQEVASDSDEGKNHDNLNSSCKEDEKDKQLALGTLRYVLKNLALVMAPSMPFYAEYLWSRVRTEGEVDSVHLAAWPEAGAVDAVVIGEMSLVREFVTLALEQRSKANIKVRQPLPKLTLAVALEPEYAALVADEVNVKVIETNTHQSDRVVLDTTITPELKAEGEARELMRAIQDARKAAGLEPQDRIALTLQTSDGGQAIVTQFESEIMKTVGATSITFGDATGSEISTGEHSFTIAINKL